MPRRRFLGIAAGAAAGGVATACGGASEGGSAAVITSPSVQWRLASSFPRSLDALFGANEILARELSALTDGRFEIRPYAAGEIVPALEVLDAAQSGSVQVGQTPSYYYTGKNAALAFDTTVPFGLTSRQHSAWILDGGGLELMRGLFSDFGIINFLGSNTGAQMGGWFRREISTLTDLKGLKMRIPGLGGEVMNRLGVTVQVLGGAEIYPALERGAIDATEWVGPYDDEKLGFHRIAKFYYYPGWWEPGSSSTFMVNKAAWDKLPSTYQKAFEIAAAAAGQRTQTVYDVKNPEALVRLLASGVQLRKFSEEIMTASANASREILETNAAADPNGYGKIYTQWKKFREDSFRWFATTEQEYSRFAFARPTG
jgi:TRAP-type mannitol/chloroaromatic compound transport system substrate-binding protein